MTQEGTIGLIILVVIVGFRFLFGRLFVNPNDPRKIHHTLKGYLLSTLATVAVFACIFAISYFDFDRLIAQTILLSVLLLAGGYYAFLEWHYIRESRRHIATLLTTVVAFMAIGGLMLWMPIA